MNIPTVELEDEALKVHCPACGALICTPESCDPCPHVLFMYDDMVGDFHFIQPRLASVVDESKKAAQDEDFDALKVLIAVLDSPSMLCFGVTTTGMACVSISVTNYIGIEFDDRRLLDNERR